MSVVYTSGSLHRVFADLEAVVDLHLRHKTNSFFSPESECSTTAQPTERMRDREQEGEKER